MLVSLYTIVLTASITAFGLITVVYLYEKYCQSKQMKIIKNVFFNEKTKQLAILYSNGTFEIKNVLMEDVSQE